MMYRIKHYLLFLSNNMLTVKQPNSIPKHNFKMQINIWPKMFVFLPLFSMPFVPLEGKNDHITT